MNYFSLHWTTCLKTCELFQFALDYQAKTCELFQFALDYQAKACELFQFALDYQAKTCELFQFALDYLAKNMSGQIKQQMTVLSDGDNSSSTMDKGMFISVFFFFSILAMEFKLFSDLFKKKMLEWNL